MVEPSHPAPDHQLRARRRALVKIGPVLAMLATLFIGMWLVLFPSLNRGHYDFRVAVGGQELLVEKRPSEEQPGHFEYRITGEGSLAERGWLDEAGFADQVGKQVEQWEARPRFERTLLGFFNITRWATFGWIAVGLLGQLAFFGRMLAQWLISEHKRESVVPESFWWLSLVGGVCLFVYFVWRVDFVGVLGQSTGLVIYARNLKLIHKQKRRLTEGASRISEAEVSAEPGGLVERVPEEPARL